MSEFILITGRTVGQGESIEDKLSEEYMQKVAVCFMNKKDMEALGINEMDVANVISSGGKVSVYVKESNIDAGIVFIPMGPWANAIIPTGTDSTGMPSFKGIGVRIERTTDKVLNADELLETLRGY